MKKFFICVLVSITFLFLTSNVSAHVLKASDSVGAVLHISPDDDPVVGQESDFFLQFKDKENKFRPENCSCVVSVKQSGKEVFSQQLFENNTNPTLENASFRFTFPQKDIYTVTITGKPNTENTFSSFTLTYDIRVAREKETTRTKETSGDGTIGFIFRHIPHLVGSILIAVFVIIAIIRERKAEKS